MNSADMASFSSGASLAEDAFTRSSKLQGQWG